MASNGASGKGSRPTAWRSLTRKGIRKGNPTQRPTARWVFERFLGIHVLFEGQRRLVLDMKDRHERIITVLGERYAELYASQPPRGGC